MNKTLIFEGEFTNENIKELITDLEVSVNNGAKNIDIYFTSNGGSISSMVLLKNYINNLTSNNIKVRFIITEYVASAAFILLFILDDVKVEFEDTAYGMVHLPTIELSSRDLKYSESYKLNYDKFLEYRHTTIEETTKKLIKSLNLSEKDRDDILKGKDVYLSYNELKDVYNTYKQMKYYESDTSVEDYINLKEIHLKTEKKLKDMEENFIKFSNLDINKLLGGGGNDI